MNHVEIALAKQQQWLSEGTRLSHVPGSSGILLLVHENVALLVMSNFNGNFRNCRIIAMPPTFLAPHVGDVVSRMLSTFLMDDGTANIVFDLGVVFRDPNKSREIQVSQGV